MKLLIIPDIHDLVDTTDKIIEKEKIQPDDTVIFLGDYFDSFGGTVGDAAKTANWLKKSVYVPNRIHLIGNHDASYLYSNQHTMCSGYTADKAHIINSILTPEDKQRLKFFHYTADILFTHAGVHSSFYNPLVDGDIEDFMESQSRRAFEALGRMSQSHWFFRAGKSRGGAQDVGGITWCDMREFKPIKGLRQIFGHSKTHTPVIFKDDISYRWDMSDLNSLQKFGGINLDTGLSHYAVYENDEIVINAFQGEHNDPLSLDKLHEWIMKCK